MSFEKLVLCVMLLALTTGAGCAADSVRIVDGFGSGNISPCAVMIHTNGNIFGMFAGGLAYSFAVLPSGDREKWLPPGDSSSFDDYGHLPKAYHGGLGVLPGNCTPVSMNTATIGIGLLYPQNRTGSTEQMESAADLVINLTRANPEIEYIFGQNVTAFYRMQDALGKGTNKDGLMYNPWHYSIKKFASLVNKHGQKHGISFGVVNGLGKYCNATSGINVTYPIEYLERIT